MNDHLVFAVSHADAVAAMWQLGLDFEETTWVMNAQLLGSGDYTNHHVHYTTAFTQVPAFQEAVSLYGNPRKDVA